MSSSTDAEKAHGGRSTRIRTVIYGERKAIALRMGLDLNERMMVYCNSVCTPANTYVTALIDSALAKNDPAASSLKRVGSRGEQRVIVSVRVAPGLRQRLTEYCSAAGISANAFVCGLIKKDLKRREKI
jgi:glutaminase